MTQYHISYNACHTMTHVWAHFEALGNNNLNACFVCWVFCFGFCCCCFWWARDSFHTLSALNCRGVFLLRLFLLAFFHLKDADFCDLQNGSASCPRPQNSPSCSRNRLKMRASAQSSSIPGALGSSKDPGMSSGLGNCPFHFLIYFTKPLICPWFKGLLHTVALSYISLQARE